MKKRVRVYKPGGQTNQPTQEQIVNYISQRMSADDFDGDTDALKAELAQAGIEDAMADDYISYVSDNLGLEDNTQLDEETQLAAEEQARAQEEEQALLEQQQEAEEEARQQQQEAMYNVEINPEDTEDTPEDEDTYMQYGGAKPNKRSFINKYTKLVKKQMGGNTPSPGSDDVLNGRETHVKGFLGAVRNTAQEAAMKQEAENEYNSAYGVPQVGAFQDGGIQQEQIDFENPMHHIGAYATGIHDIFDNPQVGTNIDFNREQFGGFTDTESGLYKFIGGGDNEYVDEEYQDADIDFNQEEYQFGGFRMPRRSGRQYTQAVGSPYYTSTGQTANPVDLANRQVSSVNVTKRGLLGRPKAYTVNYDGTTSATPAVTPATSPTTTPTGEYMPPNEFTGRRQPLANFMMRTGIPGVRGLGAKMIQSGLAPVVPNVIPETEGTQRRDSQGYPIINKTAETFGTERYDFKNNAITNPDRSPMQDFQYKPTELVGKPRIDMQMPPSRQEQYAINNADDGRQALQDFLIRHQGPAYREYGGPIDYTQYAYGGDISVPELYKAQAGVEQKFDPNANALSFPGLDDNAIMNENLSFVEPTETKKPLTPEEELLKYQRGYNQQLTYVDPKVVGENISGIGTTDKPVQQRQATSEDYLSKRDWDKTRDNFALGSMAVNAGLDIADKVRARKQENQFLENLTAAETNYGISNADDRGDYDPNSGLFRPNQMGAMKSKYGGGIYAMGGNTEDEDEAVQYMTQEEIDDFIANGGELEYL